MAVQASEIKYELHSLGWKSFQDLCASITAEVLGQTVQVFLPTKDGGRDGAFHGTWRAAENVEVKGSFVIQCKFTSKADALLTMGAVEDELEKASKLAARGLAENYILMTNYGVSGIIESEIRERFLSIAGINACIPFGREWINQKIRESARLRMMVPRVYGLGDLSQILDDRAYAQANDILSSLGDDLATFVITDAHRRSVKALMEKNFVLLLGEPASGKSTIAASLALGAIDIWGCSTIKVRNPEEFVHHWNPHEPKQFFWVDDAFGPNQYQWDLAVSWNNALPHLKAAVGKGARIVFTSRDYIYNRAKGDLKLTAFPLFVDSQVVINVQDLSKAEREQILYNHVKLGNQSRGFKAAVKPHLQAVATHHEFRPEIARRLGNTLFTRNLTPYRDALTDFVARPVAFLKEIIGSLDSESKAAIAVIFMSGGSVESPLELTAKLQHAVDLLGGTPAGVRQALTALQGSLTKLMTSEGRKIWTFKHPTIADAFAQVVAADPELLDIYLDGARIETIVKEVVVGEATVEGAKVIIPDTRYTELASRLNRELKIDAICRFLGARCCRSFLEFYFKACPEVLDHVCTPHSYLHATLQTDLLPKLQQYGLLPPEQRQKLIESVTELAIETPDADFLTIERVNQVFTPEEIRSFIATIKKDLIPNLRNIVSAWNDNYTYNSDRDPDDYFARLSEALDAYLNEFADDEEVVAVIKDNQGRIQDCIADLREEHYRGEPDWDGDEMRSSRAAPDSDRSIFDDVDT
jgi:hypothetical protein